MAELLLSYGADVNSQTEDLGIPVLALATFNPPLREFLLNQSNLEIDLLDDENYSCIDYAIEDEDVDTIQALISHGAKCHVEDFDVLSSVMKAITTFDDENLLLVLGMLLNCSNEFINEGNRFGATAVHFLAINPRCVYIQIFASAIHYIGLKLHLNPHLANVNIEKSLLIWY